MNKSTVNTSPENTLRDTLDTLSGRSDITGAVAREALNHDDPEAFFRDLANHGCISGLV